MTSDLQIGRAGATVAGLLFGTVATMAQPIVTAISPAANLRNASRMSPVMVRFSEPLNAGSVAALKVFGSQRGGLRTGHSGTTTVSGNTLTFTPDSPFQASETVRATLTTSAQNASGQPLAQSRVFEFVAAPVGGSGVFGGGSNVPSTLGLSNLVTGDVDNDGDIDVVALSSNGLGGSRGISGIVLLRNTGNGAFSFSPNYIASQGAGTFYSYLTLADVDGDGDLDLLHDEGTGRGIGIELNDGTGAYPNHGASIVGPPLGGPLVDVDGDGDLDLFHVANGMTEVLLNGGTGTFLAGSTVSGGFGKVDACGDIDGDGDVDVLSGMAIRLNNGQGVFTPGPAVPAYRGDVISSVALGDVDGDNDLDIVASTYELASGAPTIEMRLNNGSGSFSTGAVFASTLTGAKASLADVDSDGDLDLLASGATGVDTFLNNGSGAFAPGVSTVLGSNGWDMAIADVDQDGDLDFVVVTRLSTSVFLNIRLNQNVPLATRKRALAEQITVAPNPAHQRFAIGLPALPGTTVVTLRNAVGQLVLNQQIGPQAAGTHTELNAAGLAPGLYLLSVNTGEQVFAKRITLE